MPAGYHEWNARKAPSVMVPNRNMFLANILLTRGAQGRLETEVRGLRWGHGRDGDIGACAMACAEPGQALSIPAMPVYITRPVAGSTRCIEDTWPSLWVWMGSCHVIVGLCETFVGACLCLPLTFTWQQVYRSTPVQRSRARKEGRKEGRKDSSQARTEVQQPTHQ